MNIVLLGFMGSGKSEVGKILSRRTGMPLVDTDALVEERAGMSIEDIFRGHGESGFRRLEGEAVLTAARLRRTVVAIGGGAWMDEELRSALGASGHTVYLEASPDTIVERLRGEGGRPLLDVEDPPSRVGELLGQRRGVYELAESVICTDDLTPGEVADYILERLSIPTRSGGRSERVRIETGDPYDVWVGHGSAPDIGATLAQIGLDPGPIHLGTDLTVGHLYADGVERALREAGFEPTVHSIAPGEGSKTFAVARDIVDAILESNPDRGTPVVALGGGVVGDLFGFAGAITLRGLPLVAMPTTLLAQVDSSVGGKVGVNHARGKNLIGSFYQPRAVVADVKTLSTLPRSVFYDGMAEVIKHGFLSGGDYLAFLVDRGDLIRDEDPEALVDVVVGSCRIKASYVARDEREAGARVHLNLGHTAAHALETVTRGAVSHGFAVGYGLRVALRLSVARGYLDDEKRAEAEGILDEWGYARQPGDFRGSPSPRAILEHMASDKKRKGRSLRWVLLRDFGDPVIDGDVSEGEILCALEGS